VESAEDIIEELLPMVDRKLHREIKTVPIGEPPELNEKEQQLWELLGMDPLHIGAIARGADLALAETAELLLRLEIKGLVKQLPGTFFVREFSSYSF
jgi:DNA processing protein